MTYVRVPVPKLSAGLLSNTLGLLGLLLIVVAIGGLTNIYWALLAAGVEGVLLSYLIAYTRDTEETPEPTPLAPEMNGTRQRSSPLTTATFPSVK